MSEAGLPEVYFHKDEKQNISETRLKWLLVSLEEKYKETRNPKQFSILLRFNKMPPTEKLYPLYKGTGSSHTPRYLSFQALLWAHLSPCRHFLACHITSDIFIRSLPSLESRCCDSERCHTLVLSGLRPCEQFAQVKRE